MIQSPVETIKIPGQDKQFTQNNASDSLSNIFSSFNCDFTSNLGRLRLSPRYLQTTSSAIDTDLGVPIGFKYFNGTSSIWTVAGSKVHKNDGTMFGAFSVDTTTGTPATNSNYSDIEVFNNAVVVSTTGQSFYYLASPYTSWTGVSGLTNLSVPRPMLEFSGRLYIGDFNGKILSISSGWALASIGSQYTIDLSSIASSSVQVVSMVKIGATIWICTMALPGQLGYVYTWDGSSNNYTNRYEVNAQGALACVVKDQTPWIVNTNGVLMSFNGGTFVEKGRLPIDLHYLTGATHFAVNDRFIHPNGMTILDGRINLLINNQVNDNAGSIYERCPSGIWEFDEKVGLYHKSSISYTPISSTTITDYGQNRISAAGALAALKISSTSASANGRVLVGATVFTNASSTQSGVWTDDYIDTTQKGGYLVTGWLDSSKAVETWQSISTVWKQFLNSTDYMVLKYRLEEVSPTEVTGTWASTTTFTTTTNILSYFPNDGTTQYEVEILQGVGSGLCAHISSVSVSGSTYTVTLDTAFTGATGTFKARFQTWTKVLTSITPSDTQEYKTISLAKTSPRIQFKLFMVFTGKDELIKLIINSIPQQ